MIVAPARGTGKLRLAVRRAAGAEEATPDLTESHDRGKTEGVNARLKKVTLVNGCLYSAYLP